MIASPPLPQWDLSPYFSSVESDEFKGAATRLAQDVTDAEQFWIERGVPGSSVQNADVLEQALTKLNKVADQSRLIGSYLECLVTTDSKDTAAAAALSSFDSITVRIQKLMTGFRLWAKQMDIEGLAAQNPKIAEHKFFLKQAQEQAKHLMDPTLESLAADMGVTGSTAWTRLHGNFTSQIQVEVDGKALPMPAVRNLAHSGDRKVRQSAYDAELSAWERHELPIAAALNGIKGEVLILCRERGWGSPLDEALFHANVDRETIEAMMAAARDSFPTFRRYLKAKARALEVEKLAFYDLFAPIGNASKSWGYGEACDFVSEQFRAYSDKMGDFANRSFRGNWIDAEPRNGKVGGAYCAPMRADESRILMNYEPSYGSVSTLAHELGHAYHNLCLANRSVLNQETPMTLAETASIFCETIIKEAALNSVSDADQLAILEASLQGQCQVVVDITSRYLFEQSVFDKRSERELSADEFSELMLDAQRKTYGDGLDDSKLHKYMWAVKPHYYSTYSFYNFPYMFGLLFGLGLYAIYRQDPNNFRSRYDDLLSSTGLADAATLASQFGIDIRSVEFWKGSLSEIGKDVERFEQLV